MSMKDSSQIRFSVCGGVLLLVGCASNKPFIAIGSQPSPEPEVVVMPTTQPVATSDIGQVAPPVGLAPKAKPFIAVPEPLQLGAAKPSTLLLEHASPDSPVPLSQYASQPVYSVESFHLHSGLSAEAVERRMGPPAQLADAGDPWLVYRIAGSQEIWLHFTGPLQDQLDAADVIRAAEDGYVRTRVFSAEDAK
jgi:hypothetical protein